MEREQSPMGGDAEKFDAKGNKRTERHFSDGTIAWQSDEEYMEELERRKEK